jgi:hypothetical protein
MIKNKLLFVAEKQQIILLLLGANGKTPGAFNLKLFSAEISFKSKQATSFHFESLPPYSNISWQGRYGSTLYSRLVKLD